MLGEVPHFLLREQVAGLHFFHKSSKSLPRQTRKPPRGSPNSQASGNGLELGGLRSVDAWEEAPSEKREETYTEIDVKSKSSCNFAKKSSVFLFFVGAV